VFDNKQSVIIVDKKLINFETGSEVFKNGKNEDKRGISELDVIGMQTIPKLQRSDKNNLSTKHTITKKPTGISLSTNVSS